MSRFYSSGFGLEGTTSERGAVIAASGRALESPPGIYSGMYNPPSRHGFGSLPPQFSIPTSPPLSPGSSSTDVRSPTSTSTEVRSPTSTRTEVRSPTSTSTEAYTRGNFTSTVTGGAGSGDTIVNIYTADPSQWRSSWG